MKNKKRFPIKFIIIDIFLVFCVVTLFYQFYQSKKLEKNLEQVRIQSQINQEERRKQEEQERLEKQKEQEELARQEQERLEEIKKSLPTKFNMRDKIKITAENQEQTGNCGDFAVTKLIEITLNYQGNYNYNFKKVYNYLKTDHESNGFEPMFKDILGLDIKLKYDEFSGKSENDLIFVKNEIANGRPMVMLINKDLSLSLGAVNGNYVGHEMVIIGYDDTKQSWLVLNSWGPNWRNNGTFWLEYNNEGIYGIEQVIIEQNN